MVSSIDGLQFPSLAGREVVARFDGGDVTSDAGLLLVKRADERVGLTEAMSAAVEDARQRKKVRHGWEELLRSRVYAIVAGYEDANDLDTLRNDPALKMVCERLPATGPALASQPTVSRFENSMSARDQLRIALALAERVISLLPADTQSVVLDVDASEDPCHGQQELELFNGYYGSHCYLPLFLYVTDETGRQRLLGTLLRPGNAGSEKGLFGMLRRAVKLLRARFPGLRIQLRADGGFGHDAVMRWCEKHDVRYELGLTRNRALQRLSTPVQMDACLKYRWAGDGCREYGDFQYKAGPWEHERRVIIKAEITRGELNPRYVVTDEAVATPEEVYLHYCGRGDSENRIKEMKLGVQSGRTSCHRFGANQFRLLLHSAAYVLMGVLQEAADGTRWAKAQVGTVRVRLLKVGARVIETCRKVWVHLPTSFPEQAAWHRIYRALCRDVG